MAREQGKTGTSGQKAGTGGNRPKPQNTQSAKERSKAQSRPISAKAAGGRAGPTQRSGGGGGAGRGGNRPRPGSRPPAPPPPRRVSSALLAWGAVGLVIVIVAVLVIVKIATGSSANLSYTPTTAAPASVVSDVTSVPASVFNQVGTASSSGSVAPPTVISGQPPLVLNGKSPSMLYYGAEYCPYCAAERWAMVVALSRFGTFSGLKITASSHSDVYAETHTFSFYGSTLTSPYINFVPIETYSNVPLANGNGDEYQSLQAPTKQEAQIITKYSSSKYVPNASTAGGVSFPFIDIGNRVIISGASYNPALLLGASATWSEIAGNLDDPTNPATQAIVATANYITASICAVSPHAPASVCDSPGVKAAAKSLKLS
jgi:Domain of unknown function (DUF929)